MRRAALGPQLDLRIATARGARNVRAAVPRRADLQRWALAALGARGGGRTLVVQLVSQGESRRLNRAFRGKDQPTNVLSFPAALPPCMTAQLAAANDARPLGDLVLCPAVLAREARAQRKDAREHWAHLIVHGSLHLIGYDHERDGEARRMERREIAILRKLGFANPYLQRSAPA